MCKYLSYRLSLDEEIRKIVQYCNCKLGNFGDLGGHVQVVSHTK